jgi:hypothetical protein
MYSGPTVVAAFCQRRRYTFAEESGSCRPPVKKTRPGSGERARHR